MRGNTVLFSKTNLLFSETSAVKIYTYTLIPYPTKKIFICMFKDGTEFATLQARFHMRNPEYIFLYLSFMKVEYIEFPLARRDWGEPPPLLNKILTNPPYQNFVSTHKGPTPLNLESSLTNISASPPLSLCSSCQTSILATS